MDAKTAKEKLSEISYCDSMEPGHQIETVLLDPDDARWIIALIERQSQEITRLEGQHVFDNSQIVEYEGIVRVQAAKIERQEKMLAMTPQDIADLLAEIERLTSCLKFEQNYLSRVGTHADGCYKWGPGHWDCAVQEVQRLRAENEGLKCCGNCKHQTYDGMDYGCEVVLKNYHQNKCDKWQGVK